jgi:hypothetical protein
MEPERFQDFQRNPWRFFLARNDGHVRFAIQGQPLRIERAEGSFIDRQRSRILRRAVAGVPAALKQFLQIVFEEDDADTVLA